VYFSDGVIRFSTFRKRIFLKTKKADQKHFENWWHRSGSELHKAYLMCERVEWLNQLQDLITQAQSLKQTPLGSGTISSLFWPDGIVVSKDQECDSIPRNNLTNNSGNAYGKRCVPGISFPSPPCSGTQVKLPFGSKPQFFSCQKSIFLPRVWKMSHDLGKEAWLANMRTQWGGGWLGGVSGGPSWDSGHHGTAYCNCAAAACDSERRSCCHSCC